MKERPETLPAVTYRIPTGFGNMYVSVSMLDGKPFEVFVTVGKAGSSIAAKAEAVGRLVSLALRNEISVEEIVKQLVDIRGGDTWPWKDAVIWSIPDAVGKVLRDYYADRARGTEETILGMPTTEEVVGEMRLVEGLDE